MRVVEVFAGCGGFGALADTLGHTITMGIDNDSVALDSWGANNPNGLKRCITLPPTTPIDWPEGTDHVHFSSPCQSFSGAKRNASDDEKSKGDELLRWSIETAFKFPSWSIENVVSTRSKAILEEFKTRFPGKIAYETVQCADFGAPQLRTRLVAGPPALMQRLKQLPKTRRVTIAEAFKEAGLDLKSNSVRSTAQLRSGDGPCTRQVAAPAYTVLTRPLKWDFGEGMRGKTFTVEEMAVLQGFPSNFKFPAQKKDAFRVIGNAVPCKLGLVILAAASGVAGFTVPIPPAITYVDATNTMRPVHTPLSPGMDDRLSRLEGALSEIKTMLSQALVRKKRRV